MNYLMEGAVLAQELPVNDDLFIADARLIAQLALGVALLGWLVYIGYARTTVAKRTAIFSAAITALALAIAADAPILSDIFESLWTRYFVPEGGESPPPTTG